MVLRLKIVYDNEAEPGFEKGWGFSCLVELEDEKILLDTGWDGNVLLGNLKKFNVQPEEIDRVVLSHAHWDHIGGLPHIRRRDLRIYAPYSFSKHLRSELAARYELHEVKGAQKIREGVWTTGELGKEIKEQSLVLKTSQGLVIIAGCSHPGVRKIISVASKFGKVWGYVGGMHDFKDFKVLDGLGIVAPSHCTVRKRRISKLFPNVCLDVKAGSEIKIG